VVMEQKLRQELKLKAKQIKNALQKLKGKIKEKYNIVPYSYEKLTH